jgi:DNA-directed RNA polymerase specialized sigma24 family protein
VTEESLANFEYRKKMDSNTYQDYIKGNQSLSPKDLKEYGEKQKDFVRERVTLLPTGELAVIYLKFWEELDESEISRTLAMHVLKVRKLLSLALLRLKEDFADEHKAFLTNKESLCA